jgi:probable H4MPT-linked C1 transfer pathway protein
MRLRAFDIGGANIKTAWCAVDDDGSVRDLRSASIPFELWREPHGLARRLREAASGSHHDALAITMTGELCDCFTGRRDGVRQVLDSVERFAEGKPARVWLTEGRFAAVDEARDKWLAAASANWHAQATWIARLFPLDVSLLIDTGSTTTDIVLLRNGAVDAPGLTDMARLNGGLVYTGARRTPVMSISPVSLRSRMPDDGPTHLMAEHFATMADVYVLTGDLPEDPDIRDTADGRPLTCPAAAARLLRMAGADDQVYEAMLSGQTAALELAGLRAEGVPMRVARELAHACADAQRDRITEGIRRVRLAGSAGAMNDPLVRVERVIVSGSGDFVAARAAEAAIPGVPLVRLAGMIGRESSAAACAVALLHLWRGTQAGVRGY